MGGQRFYVDDVLFREFERQALSEVQRLFRDIERRVNGLPRRRPAPIDAGTDWWRAQAQE